MHCSTPTKCVHPLLEREMTFFIGRSSHGTGSVLRWLMRPIRAQTIVAQQGRVLIITRLPKGGGGVFLQNQNILLVITLTHLFYFIPNNFISYLATFNCKNMMFCFHLFPCLSPVVLMAIVPRAIVLVVRVTWFR